MWAFAGTVWDVESSSMWAVAAFMRAAQSLCGMSQPLLGMPLVKKENEDIVCCSGYRAFEDIPRACPSLTTRACVGLRFDPRRSRPATITGNDDMEPRRVTKTGTKTGKQG